jgi:hypothetical protein
LSKSEVDRVSYLAFYYLETENKREFTISEVIKWFSLFHFATPNTSRLSNKLKKSSYFIRGSKPSSFSLHVKSITTFRQSFPWLHEESEEIVFTGEILPSSVTIGTRGYIEQLGKQINAAYENNIFDGCSVLMRRLVEILLIHSYDYTSQENLIRESNDKFKDLQFIIADAKSNKKLRLSKGTKDCLDEFRILGNFSAHKIEYNCKRGDIKRISLDYRAAIEELLYKSGLKK